LESFQEADDPPAAEPNKEQEEFLSKLRTTVEEVVSPVRDSVKAMQDRWAELEKAATAPPPPEKKDPADPNTDPQGWMREQLTPLAMQNIQTNARLTEREVLDEVAPYWAHLLPEIKKMFAETALVRKAAADYPIYCRNIVSLVVGKAAQEAGLRFDGQSKRFFLEDATSKGEHGDPLYSDPNLTWTDPRNPTKTLTASQQLANLGISPKDFAESVKRGVV